MNAQVLAIAPPVWEKSLRDASGRGIYDAGFGLAFFLTRQTVPQGFFPNRRGLVSQVAFKAIH